MAKFWQHLADLVQRHHIGIMDIEGLAAVLRSREKEVTILANLGVDLRQVLEILQEELSRVEVRSYFNEGDDASLLPVGAFPVIFILL